MLRLLTAMRSKLKTSNQYRSRNSIQCFSTQKPDMNRAADFWLPQKFSPDHFLHSQRESWYRFLNQGLAEEFYHFRSREYVLEKNDIPTANKVIVTFYAENYRLIRPRLTPRLCILKRRNYSSPLFIPVEFNHQPRGLFILKWFCIANLPLMTKQGNFIINGSPRVVLSQVVRSPGVYFRKAKTRSHGKVVLTADFIAQRGAWLRLEVDNTKEIVAKVKKMPRIPLMAFLRCLGLPIEIMHQYVNFFQKVRPGRNIYGNATKQRFVDKYLKSDLFVERNFEFDSEIGREMRPFVDRGFEPNSVLGRELRLIHLALAVYRMDTLEQDEIEMPDALTLFRRDDIPSSVELRRMLADPDIDSNDKKREVINALDSKKIERAFLRPLLNPRNYSLSVSGRHRLNQMLGLNLPSHMTLLTPIDILFGCFYLLECLQHNQSLSDIDHLQNRMVKPVGQQLQNQLALGLRRLEKVMTYRMPINKDSWIWLDDPDPKIVKKQIKRLRKVIQPRQINQVWLSFFASNPLSQMMDHTNALAEITHKRRLSSLGLGGVDRKTATMAVRGIHYSHYGRICPIETPEGQNAGLVNSLTTYATVDTLGQIQTPFQVCYNGVIVTEKMPILFAPQSEKTKMISPGDVERNRFGFLPLNAIGHVPAREQQNYRRVERQTIDLVATTPRQMVSIATSLIPFLEHNDGNRALMGSNMQRQAVPTLRTQKPMVTTGFESKSVADVDYGIQADAAGLVGYVDGQKVIVYDNIQPTWSYTPAVSYGSRKKLFGFQPQVEGRLTRPLFWFSGQSYMRFMKRFDVEHISYGLKAIQPWMPLTMLPLFRTHYQRSTLIGCANLFLKQSFFHSKKDSCQTNTHTTLHDPAAIYHVGRYWFLTGAGILLTTWQQNRFTYPTRHDSGTIQPITHLSGSADRHRLPYRDPKLKQDLLPFRTSFLSQDRSRNPYFNCKPTALTRFNFVPNLEDLAFKKSKISFEKIYINPEQVPCDWVPSLIPKQCRVYALEDFSRTNQDTYLVHRPHVHYGQWVEKGDSLVDNASSRQGELALGQNLLVGYTPWQGYNFEDAVLLNERMVYDDVLTSLHIERYKIDIKDTPHGSERLTKDRLPSRDWDITWNDLDNSGIVPVGTWVNPGHLLVGKLAPVEAAIKDQFEALLFDVLRKLPKDVRETSVRAPHDLYGRVIHVERIASRFKMTLARRREKWVKKLVPYRSDLELEGDYFFGPKRKRPARQPKPQVQDRLNSIEQYPAKMYLNLRTKQQAQKGKSNLANPKTPSFDHRQPTRGRGWNSLPSIISKSENQIRTSSRVLQRTRFNLPWYTAEPDISRPAQNERDATYTGQVYIYVAVKRNVQVGDKISGRHGNKGIVSRILPCQDMPYLPDGTPLDLVLNPLGVPSRMNVGQIFECLLGLAGSYLHQHFKIQPFDEIYGCETSRSFVYSKLYEARLKTKQNWLFDPSFPGKVPLFDGRSGLCFEQPVTVGKAYILKLIHMVDEKIHARSTGPYSLITQQPLRGRSKKGGQRLGEMEVWALEGFGAAYALQELLTFKSDDIYARNKVFDIILNNGSWPFSIPEAFKVLMLELRALNLDLVLQRNRKNIDFFGPTSQEQEEEEQRGQLRKQHEQQQKQLKKQQHQERLQKRKEPRHLQRIGSIFYRPPDDLISS
jgi:DNA-directed RNA polymerase beta subunit